MHPMHLPAKESFICTSSEKGQETKKKSDKLHPTNRLPLILANKALISVPQTVQVLNCSHSNNYKKTVIVEVTLRSDEKGSTLSGSKEFCSRKLHEIVRLPD